MITIGQTIVPDHGITDVNTLRDQSQQNWHAFVIVDDEYRGLIVDTFDAEGVVTVRRVKYRIYGHSSTKDGKIAVYLTKV